MKKSFFVCLMFCFCMPVFSQNFNINAYKDFLNSHQNLTSAQLLSLYDAGRFKGTINSNFLTASFGQQVKNYYLLTPHEQFLLNKNGFMVTERLSFPSFGHAFLDVYHKDLPVFISSDAILHSIHKSYDNILMDVELGVLITKLKELLNQMHLQMSALNSLYGTDSLMYVCLKDVDVYLTVARKLLLSNADPFYPDNLNWINIILGNISQLQPQDISLFSNTGKIIDFSQFKVRGHYDNSQYPELAKYFQSMIWLSRIELYLLAPKAAFPEPDFNDIKRQTIVSALLNEAILNSGCMAKLTEIDGIIKFFVGESDNVTVDNLNELLLSVNVTSANQLIDNSKLNAFQDSLKTKSYAFQKILSQILYSNPMSPDSIVPASSFLLLGQRFIFDSYVASQVVYDRIKYNGQKIRRMLPSSLDILFALGNSASGQLLQNELNSYHYSSNLAALRYLVDSYPNEFWEQSLYNRWLNMIKCLNPPENRINLPSFMQSAAWWQEKMNTQLSSWSQLRHDNLLYAKPSYTGGVICSYPYGYVEPFPQLYMIIKDYAVAGFSKISSLTFTDNSKKQLILNYFSDLKNYSDTLKSISDKELSSTQLSQEEKVFLKKVIYDTLQGCAVSYNGWYTKLFYPFFGNSFLDADYITADIHTAPTDAAGTPVGWVLHAGTGKINMGVFTANNSDNQPCNFTGPVMSYHQYTTSNFFRINDNEWKTYYLNISSRPDFVNLYLADSTGNTKGPGPSLITLNNELPIEIPTTVQLLQNYPNPFNNSTRIGFTIPYDMTNSLVVLTIYGINGETIKTLVNQNLPSNQYFIDWDGRNNSGRNVSSGVFICELKVGDRRYSNKIVLLK